MYELLCYYSMHSKCCPIRYFIPIVFRRLEICRNYIRCQTVDVMIVELLPSMDGKSSTIITKLCTLALTFAQKRCETEQEHCQAIACNQEPDPGAKGAGISIAAEAGDTRRGDGSIALSIYAGGSAGRWCR